MASSNPSQLFLLADHIKLSLLERQRAVSMKLDSHSQDSHISRSLDSLGSGIETIDNQLLETPNSALSEQVSTLRTQYNDMLSQFHGSNTKTSSTTLTSPNSSSLAPDFSAATSRPDTKRTASGPKSVRFKDSSRSPSPDQNRAALFPYRDDPSSTGYQDDDSPDQSHLDNQQIHDYHRQVIQDQDDHLDVLSTSIGRQRDLSMAIGDELDEQALMLGDVEEATDRHQGQLNRAQGRLETVARKARENWGMTIIIILIIILVLLIIILK